MIYYLYAFLVCSAVATVIVIFAFMLSSRISHARNETDERYEAGQKIEVNHEAKTYEN
jgi:hypothetical protein